MGLFSQGPEAWENNAQQTAIKAKKLADWATAHPDDPQGKGPGGPNQNRTDADLAGIGRDLDNAGKGLGYVPKHADPNAPGGSLDTSGADAERARMAPLLAQLQEQAQTGGGAWEQALAAGTAKAGAGAEALGQSQPGVGYADALRNIGQAQGAVGQRSAGQANILRAQSKIGAQNQLTGLLGAEGETDANQASARAAAQQGITELNTTLAGQANDKITKDTGAITHMFGMTAGGDVPGRARTAGDNASNDTVPAMLSPGEIVIPRSHAHSPEAAADFVRALKSRGVQHFDAGGQAGDGTGLSGPDSASADTARKREAGAVSVFLPHVGQLMRTQQGVAPSIENGSLFDTGAYDKNRSAQLANAELIAQRSTGNGPSVAPQQMQNAADENIAAAMRGGGADAVLAGATGIQRGAGAGGENAGAEQYDAQGQFGHALLAQRARDNAFAQAAQQAAFRNTQMNAGLDLAHQAQLRSLLASAGHAAMDGPSKGGGKNPYAGSDMNTPGFDQGVGNMSSPDEWSNPYSEPGRGSAGDISSPDEKWKGGEIHDTRAEDFVRALKRRKAA